MEERIEKTLLFVNSSKSMDGNGTRTAVFEDLDGNRYEYKFARMNKFSRSSSPFEYFPTLQTRKHKQYIKLSFRIIGIRINPLNGKSIYQITYPKLISDETGGDLNGKH